MLTFNKPLSARARRREAEHFSRVHRAEQGYAILLRKVGRQVGELVRAMANSADPDWLNRLEEALARYAEALTPWAKAVAGQMLAEVARRDAMAWQRFSAAFGVDLRREIEATPLGAVMRQRLDTQVALITSLPREAAQRVRNLATSGYASGARAGEIRRFAPSAFGPLEQAPEGLAKEILRTGEVTVARANLIARTEVTRTATELTRVRAEYVGSTHAVWNTAHDRDVRPAHKRLEGVVFRWDDPPVADDNGKRYLPGAAPNCRCWPAPILPRIIS